VLAVSHVTYVQPDGTPYDIEVPARTSVMKGAIRNDVPGIDRDRRAVRLGDHCAVPYAHLVLATGARPRPLPIPGSDLRGVVRLCNRADSDQLREQLASVEYVVLIGAGFIGLELAAAATLTGHQPVIMDVGHRVLGRAVSPQVSEYAAALHRGRGAILRLTAVIRRFLGAGGCVSGVELGTGEVIPAQLVVVDTGVVPRDELARDAGLVVTDGIVVDEQLRTSDPAVSAVGDCARFPGADGAPIRLESVQNAVDQGRHVAARLLGADAAYREIRWFWSYQGDFKIQIAGLPGRFGTCVERGDWATGRFSLFWYRGEQLTCVESINHPAGHMMARRLLAARPPLGGLRPPAATHVCKAVLQYHDWTLTTRRLCASA
jgi:3-phenylpropionate/trans-cinnamate dioxygenase ferredoxin reductase subunit